MREPANIRAVEALGIDYMGFIFHPQSPRHVAAVPEYMPSTCRRTGVFVNADTPTVLEAARLYSLQAVQLHGGEPADICRQLQAEGMEVIKVFHVGQQIDTEAMEPYHGCCRYFLFDTACATNGGSGRAFNWNLLDRYIGPTPFLLSGGINPLMADQIKALSHPMLAGIDLNSGFETAPAIKNVHSLAAFLNNIRQIKQ